MSRLRSILLMCALIVPMVGCQAMIASQHIDDVTITSAVKSRFAGDPALNMRQIDVDTHDGTVYLIGWVSSEDAGVKAEQLARGVSGVKEVINSLRVAQP